MARIDRDTIIYHTETKKDYDALIDDLDKKGYMWQSFMPLKIRDYWGVYQEKTCIGVRSEGKNVFCSSFSTLIHSYEIYKYEAKEDFEMKIYHTETQEDYDALMVELEAKGYTWGGTTSKPTQWNGWSHNKENTCIRTLPEDKELVTMHKAHYVTGYPQTPITKYKAKADEKMRFTKENVYKLFTQYRKDGISLNDLQDEILKLDDTQKKVVVPKFVAEWIEWNKESGVGLRNMLRCFTHFCDNADSIVSDGEKAVQWYVDNPYKFIQAYEDGYTIESDTVTEQRYTVVIADRYLVQLFIGRTDYRFVEFDELCAWKPNAFQLTEDEIKAIDERYWTFAAPVASKGGSGMKTMYTITVNNDEYARGLYNTRDEALAEAVKMARDENAPEWDGLDDEEVYDYQDGYYHVMEIEVDENEE